MAGHPVEAERAFREALRRRRGPSIALAGLAESLIGLGHLADARDLFGIVPRRGRLATLIERGYGDICFAEQRYDDAWRYYRAALQSLPTGPGIIAAVEKELSAGQTTAEAAARHYRNALTRVLDVAKKRRSERDWLALGRRLAHIAWTASRSRNEQSAFDAPSPRPAPRLRTSTVPS
jgi:tetratricopeptide (TPR) repeat protein